MKNIRVPPPPGLLYYIYLPLFKNNNSVRIGIFILQVFDHVKHKCNLTSHLVAADLPLVKVTFQLLLKQYSGYIDILGRVITKITLFLRFITGNCWPQVDRRKVSVIFTKRDGSSAAISFGVNLHLFL